MSGSLNLVKDGEGYSEVFGAIGGLTITETVYGYVGMFKSCTNHHLLDKQPYPELFTIELDMLTEAIPIENIKVNFVDQYGHVHFYAFKSLSIK